MFFTLALASCDGVAWNTTVADNMAVRYQMAESVVPGKTTEMEFVTRWGRPVQKVREGGQVEYIYRNMRDDDPQVIQFGDSTRYVIVTFQYGVATGVRTSETELCRAAFAPRPPGHAYANPTVVHPVGTCPGLYRPTVGSVGGVDMGGGGPLAGAPVEDDSIYTGGKAGK